MPTELCVRIILGEEDDVQVRVGSLVWPEEGFPSEATFKAAMAAMAVLLREAADRLDPDPVG